jgi:hypothetical protein
LEFSTYLLQSFKSFRIRIWNWKTLTGKIQQ